MSPCLQRPAPRREQRSRGSLYVPLPCCSSVPAVHCNAIPMLVGEAEEDVGGKAPRAENGKRGAGCEESQVQAQTLSTLMPRFIKSSCHPQIKTTRNCFMACISFATRQLFTPADTPLPSVQALPAAFPLKSFLYLLLNAASISRPFCVLVVHV